MEMPWRSEISASDTASSPACNARSSIVVTAYRPLVVSRISTTLMRVYGKATNPEYFGQVLAMPPGRVAPGSARRVVVLAGHRVEVLVLERRQLLVAAADTLLGQRGAHAVDLGVHRVHVIEQQVDRLGHRVGHMVRHPVSLETDLLGHLLTVALGLIFRARNDSPGNADHGSADWHILGHHRVRTNTSAIGNGNRAQHLGTGTNHHIIAQRRVTLALVPGGAAQGDAMV